MQGQMIVQLERKNGQVRNFVCNAGTTEITAIPGNLRMEWNDDPEFGGWTMTSPNGNVVMRVRWSPVAPV